MKKIPALICEVTAWSRLGETASSFILALTIGFLFAPSPSYAACDFSSSPGLIALSCTGTISVAADYSQVVGFTTAGTIGSINSSGGVGGNGLDIVITSDANLIGSGLYTEGFLVFSAGGDGAVNGSGGIGGDGGTVTVISSGTISTEGTGSPAIFAESFGGIGAVNGSGGTGGDGSVVTVSSAGAITTTGDLSHGIMTASFGAAGAINGNGVGGNAGVVTVTSYAGITASGANSDAIHAYSAGGPGALNGSGPDGSAANVTVNITGGTVQGGSSAGYGVYIATGSASGNTATLNNDGIISALSGNAIRGIGANVYVGNRGTVIGNVDLSGANANFDNRETGIFESGSSVNAFV